MQPTNGSKPRQRSAMRKRPTKIHLAYCKHCPSAPGLPSDPEAEELAASDYETRKLAAFPCAWRPEKLCKGICEELRITEADFLHQQVPDNTTDSTCNEAVK